MNLIIVLCRYHFADPLRMAKNDGSSTPRNSPKTLFVAPNHNQSGFDHNHDHDDHDFDAVQERISETCQLEVALENKTGKLSPAALSKKSNDSDCPLLNEEKAKKNKRRKQKLPKPLFFPSSKPKTKIKERTTNEEEEEGVEKTII